MLKAGIMIMYFNGTFEKTFHINRWKQKTKRFTLRVMEFIKIKQSFLINEILLLIIAK